MYKQFVYSILTVDVYMIYYIIYQQFMFDYIFWV